MTVLLSLLLSVSVYADNSQMKRISNYSEIPGHVSHCNVFFKSEMVTGLCNDQLNKNAMYKFNIEKDTFRTHKETLAAAVYLLEKVGFKIVSCFPPTKTSYNCLMSRGAQ